MTESRTFTVRFNPPGSSVACDRRLTILEAAQGARVELLALCGGLGSCGRCRVKVKRSGVSPLTQRERDVLSEEEIAAGYRLACRTFVEGDATVGIPDVSRPGAQQLQLAGREEPVSCCPAVRKIGLELREPTLSDPRSDLARISEALASREGAALESVDYALLPALSPVLREGRWRATVALDGSELVQIEPGDTTERMHGMAFDLGSTKIAAYLVELVTGAVIDAQGVMNPQVVYGEDIATRIDYAVRRADGAMRLQEVVVEAVAGLIRSLCEGNGLSSEEVLEVVVVGNTAMHHLFLGLSTRPLTASPFVPIVTRSLRVKARELGLPAAPGAYVTCPAPVAGFVGSDHVAMILASRLPEREGVFLGIDIGTNTEISLKKGRDITAVSCASGPAFEGAAISCGMKAASGAIERMWIDPDSQEIRASTVGDAQPVGICGSGILDCVASMRRVGMLDARGHIQRDARHVRVGGDGLPELVVAETRDGHLLTVTQQDVERIQLAKGAVRSGIEVLMDAAGIAAADVDGVILAGAFGTFVDPLSAMEIGMLPPVAPERIVQVGNAAGVGAKEMLVSSARRRQAEEIAARLRYLELTVYPRYSRFFAHALRF
ncbi:MAG: ASKHA domain-containing protein [Anaerolineae bacterium]|jgi:uncharacterized 2Fe-2S/4Fe-4S cluster protein (DUF4445 family)